MQDCSQDLSPYFLTHKYQLGSLKDWIKLRRSLRSTEISQYIIHRSSASSNYIWYVLVFIISPGIIERKKERKSCRNQLLCQVFLEVRNKSRAGFYAPNLVSNQYRVFPSPCCWVPLTWRFISIQHSWEGLHQVSILQLDCSRDQ